MKGCESMVFVKKWIIQPALQLPENCYPWWTFTSHCSALTRKGQYHMGIPIKAKGKEPRCATRQISGMDKITNTSGLKNQGFILMYSKEIKAVISAPRDVYKTNCTSPTSVFGSTCLESVKRIQCKKSVRNLVRTAGPATLKCWWSDYSVSWPFTCI